jgi:serine/threonine protein kinase
VPPSSCLSADAIAHYVQGKLSDAESEQLEEHVQECAGCLEALNGEADTEPYFLAVLSPAGRPGDLPAPDGELAALKVKLKALRLADRSPATDEHDPHRTQSGADHLAAFGLTNGTGWLGGYRIIAKLGHGGMGAVFRAEDPRLQRDVAVKVMLPEFAGDRNSRARFQREARSAAALQHDNIVPIYHVGEDRDIPYLVMPLLSGEPLDKRLVREPSLTLAETLRIGRELALGLAAAHARGLVHRDIKPANIWLEKLEQGQTVKDVQGEKAPLPPFRVKILDFGLARLDESKTGGAGLTLPGSVMGTPEYMSPEQARGEPADFRSDLYNVGLVLYRLTAGKLPFTASTPSGYMVAHASEAPPDVHKLNPKLPPLLAQTIMRLLQKQPVERLASAQELADTLGRLLQPNADPTVSYRRPPVAGPRIGSRRLLAVAAVVALLLVPAGLWRFWPQPIAVPPMQQPLVTTIESTVEGKPTLLVADSAKKLAGFMPLRVGDKVELNCDVPRGFQAALFLLDTTGEVQELTPLHVGKAGAFDRLRFPANGMWQMDGPPGTVLFLVCANRGVRPVLDEVRALLQEGEKPSPLPTPSENFLMLLNRDEVLKFGEAPRDVVETPYSRLRGRLERRREAAAGRFDYVWGAALPVR